MKSQFFITALAVGVAFAIGSANAGPCTQQIEQLQKALSSKDAGAGPTAATPSTATGSTTGSETVTPKAGEVVPGADATAAMNEATKGKAASPEDVVKQTEGEPTTSEAAEAAQTSPAAGPTEAMASLERAKQFDQTGDEAQCMSAVEDAKQKLGQ
jgi:hypothetical protein